MNKLYPGAGDEAIDFLNRILVFNPYFRISVDESLSHPFFKKVRKLEKEVKSSTSITIEFEKEQRINCVVIREDQSKGQHCSQFRLLLMNKKHELIREIKGTTIGRKRILTFPDTDAAIIALAVDEQKGTTVISEIEIYNIDPKLIEK